jgi:type IV secretory pathway VirB3-like protein
MKKSLIDLIPLFVMAFFTIEMTAIVLIILNNPLILLAYIPLYICIIYLIIFRKKEKKAE